MRYWMLTWVRLGLMYFCMVLERFDLLDEYQG